MRNYTYIAVTALALCGCATYQPNRQTSMIVPMMDASMNPKDRDVQQDIKECNWYANGVAGVGESALTSGLGGAALGAAIGAMTGAAFGANIGGTAAYGAFGGGMTGLVGGAANSIGTKRQVVANCMKGRGYSVLAN